ncbi:MAG: NUDIX domain-containing protein [Boseongicola sp.]|nr:MAG: NUDIX domain-containing protein [Boseongicola sp.]
MLQRPKHLQVAALCYKVSDNKTQVLLITSRDTGRWIIPKGWPEQGLTTREAAIKEAWEEAGVVAEPEHGDTIGSYSYDKIQSTGWPLPVETLVYPVAVDTLADDFPEAHERKRKWVDPEEAANLVNEPELKSILRNL